MGWHRCVDHISAFSKFDQGVEKALCCAQKLHGRHICCMGESLVMFSVTYMGSSVFALLTAMVNGPKLGNSTEMIPGQSVGFHSFRLFFPNKC